jgi:3-hydroxybutyrate dehydrogenase
MKEEGWGRIINIASIHGMVASPFKAGYITAKHALVGLTKAISSESAPHGITCNAITPFYVNTNLVTDQVRAQVSAWGTSEDRVVEDILLKNSPVKRLIEPHEIASLAMYLCTDESSAINGAVLPMDHGYKSQ